MSLQSSHLTHAWLSTTLWVMSHHVSFFWILAETVFLQEMLVVFVEWMNSQKVCLLAQKSPTVVSQICTQSSVIHCDSHATLAPVCLLWMERDLVCNKPSLKVFSQSKKNNKLFFPYIITKPSLKWGVIGLESLQGSWEHQSHSQKTVRKWSWNVCWPWFERIKQGWKKTKRMNRK